jgi:hypothetical protein
VLDLNNSSSAFSHGHGNQVNTPTAGSFSTVRMRLTRHAQIQTLQKRRSDLGAGGGHKAKLCGTKKQYKEKKSLRSCRKFGGVFKSSSGFVLASDRQSRSQPKTHPKPFRPGCSRL